MISFRLTSLSMGLPIPNLQMVSLLFVMTSLLLPAPCIFESVLVFGGNGFMGSEVASALLSTNHSLTLVNRGNMYFDSDQRVGQHVSTVKCDRYAECTACERKNSLLNCDDFSELLSAETAWDYVIDFSAYRSEVVTDALEALENKFGVYILISTDSVYEVSVPANHPGPSLETDAVRPDDAGKRKELAGKDSYGDKKLAAEEALIGSGVPYVILRLPDVIGPRDSTDRWWTYQMWMKYYHVIQQPFYVPPKVASVSSSMVFVKDVAQAVLSVLERKDEVLNEVFNVAFQEQFTLSNLLRDLSEEMTVESVEADYTDNPKAFHLFPSVYRGPVDISKAQRKLKFQPTPWADALRETVEFYENAFAVFPAERDLIIARVATMIVPKRNNDMFLDVVEGQIQRIDLEEETDAKDGDENPGIGHEEL